MGIHIREFEDAIREECAAIAAMESSYWQAATDQTMRDAVCAGAISAATNIHAAILMGKTVDQVKTDIEMRHKRAEST